MSGLINYTDIRGAKYNKANNRIFKDVLSASDFGTAVGGVITLEANTTYIIKGTVNLGSDTLLINADGISLRGTDRSVDILQFDATGTMIETFDVDFSISNLTLTAPNGTIINASNYTAGIPANAYGRIKVLTMFDIQVRNTDRVGYISGYELVDINNSLFWYITGSIGLELAYNRHLEINSCEFYNWFDEPTGTTYSTARMINLNPNSGDGVGFAVVNMVGNIIHPEDVQYGLSIANTSTTFYGTISSNTFIDVGLTSTATLYDIDYDIQNTYIIQANQLLPNSNAYATMQLTGNAVDLDNATTNPLLLTEANTVLGGGFTNPIVFPISQRTINTSADGKIEYNSKITATFFVVISATVSVAGNGVVTLRFAKNGVAIPGSPEGIVEIKSGIAQLVSFSILGTTEEGDEFQVEVESNAGQNVLVSDLTLNGYQI